MQAKGQDVPGSCARGVVWFWGQVLIPPGARAWPRCPPAGVCAQPACMQHCDSLRVSALAHMYEHAPGYRCEHKQQKDSVSVFGEACESV